MTAAFVLIGVLMLPAGAYIAFHIWRPVRRMEDEDLEGYLVRLFIWPVLGLFTPVALIAAGLVTEPDGGSAWGLVLAVALEVALVWIARRQKAQRGA